MNYLADIEAQHRQNGARAYAEKVMTLAPSNVALLFEQDAIVSEYGEGPGLGDAWRFKRVALERCNLTDSELAAYIIDLREARKLPLSDVFIDGLAWIQSLAEEEARRRLTKLQRAKSEGRYKAWEDADLIAEIEVIAGQGRRVGSAVWFHCPLAGHANGDRTASLEVDGEKKVWMCHSRHGGGGVVAWRRAIR